MKIWKAKLVFASDRDRVVPGVEIKGVPGESKAKVLEELAHVTVYSSYIENMGFGAAHRARSQIREGKTAIIGGYRVVTERVDVDGA